MGTLFLISGLPGVEWKSKRCCNIFGMCCFLPKFAPCILIFQLSFINRIILYQIDQEREGEQIDRALLKNVLDIFVEIGMGQMDSYENDFEAAMLIDTSGYYSRKASSWILEDSCPDYMLKVGFKYSCYIKASFFVHS